MKRLVVLAILMLSVVSLAQDDTSQLNWLTNLDEAEEIANTNHQPILLYFTGSDWCTPCKALKTDFFETEAFAERAKGIVLVMIDYPRRMDIISDTQKTYNKGVIAKYNDDKSFPKLIMLNGKGKEIGKLSGYSSFNTYKDTSHHFAFVDEFIAKYN